MVAPAPGSVSAPQPKAHGLWPWDQEPSQIQENLGFPHDCHNDNHWILKTTSCQSKLP